jgi:four helix bundle protein
MEPEEKLTLSHEKLDAYRCAIEFLAVATAILSSFPRGHADLADQLRRASLSIPLNIAEGVGKTTVPDKRRHFGIARGSGMECSAILDAARVLSLIEAAPAERGKRLLVRVISMLTKLAR